jgi:hypothetical protein
MNIEASEFEDLPMSKFLENEKTNEKTKFFSKNTVSNILKVPSEIFNFFMKINTKEKENKLDDYKNLK